MTQKKKKKLSPGSALLLCLICLLLAVAANSGWQLWGIYSKYHHNTVSQNRVSDVFYSQEGTTGQTVSGMEGTAGTQTQLKENTLSGAVSLWPLIAQNPDTVGWIKIEDTVVDYAVMWSGDNDYYLHRDFFREYNYAGMPFLDGSNYLQNQLPGQYQNYIIYGHRMKDKSMFHIIGEYSDQEWYEEHPTFTLLLRVGDEDILYECQVFSCYRLTTADEDSWMTIFYSKEDYENYINRAISRSAIKTDVSVTGDDQILTLSTCDSMLDESEGRLLVHAKMVPMVVTPVSVTPNQN